MCVNNIDLLIYCFFGMVFGGFFVSSRSNVSSVFSFSRFSRIFLCSFGYCFFMNVFVVVRFICILNIMYVIVIDGVFDCLFM